MNVGGRPYPKLWGKYKKPYPRFSEIWLLKPIKIDFFKIISHNYLLFSHFTCQILQYLHDFKLKQRKKNLENFSKISVFIKIFSFQDRRLFTFHVITWLNFDLEQKFFHQNIPQ